MSCRNKSNGCNCRPVSPCDDKQDYCCICYSHQWYNAPRYSECSRRVKVNDISDCGCDCDCGCNTQVTAQDNFSFNSCNRGYNNDSDNAFNEIDEIYWQ